MREVEMKLDFVEINKNFGDIEELTLLKNEAFPELDMISMDVIVQIHEDGDGFSYAVYDKDRLVGFIVFFSNKDCAYIANLAVDKSLRNKGYGTEILSQIIEHLKNKNPDIKFAVMVEYPHPDSKNFEQRKARISFYKKLGFVTTDSVEEYEDIDYLIMTTDKNIKKEDFESLEKHIEQVTDKYSL